MKYLGTLHYEWDDLDFSGRWLAEGMELARRTGEITTLVQGYVALSRLKRAQGDTEGAREGALEAERLAQRSGVGQAIAEAATWKARLHLMDGEMTAAAAFEHERTASAENAERISAPVRNEQRTVLARLLLARRDSNAALRLLEECRQEAEASGRTGRLIEILALQALAFRDDGEKERAVSTLAQALVLAESERYVRTFVDEGSAMATLITEVLEVQQRRRLAPEVPAYYLRKLLAILEREASSIASPGADLAEPLSEREHEVLALLAAGKSNQQIAKDLFISPTTIKTHINNVYRKLDVRSRTQAVSRARELGLL